MATVYDSSQIFSSLSSKVVQLLYSRSSGDRETISKILDDINSLNFNYLITSQPTKAVLLINQCCTFIATDDEQLVQKCCNLIVNIVKHQNIMVEGRTLVIAIQWCLQSLRIKNKAVTVDILQSLDALLRSNPQSAHTLIDNVVKELQPLLSQNDNNAPEITLFSLLCLEASTAVPTTPKTKKWEDSTNLQLCAEIFTTYLCKKLTFNELISSKILKICLNGLQNVILQVNEYLQKNIGIVLGIVKSYMVYGINGIDFIEPQKILPSAFNVPEAPGTVRDKKGGKATRQRKPKSSVVDNKRENSFIAESMFDKALGGYIPGTISLDLSSDGGNSCGLTTSDSEFSDNEGKKQVKISKSNASIRQAALNLLYHVIKETDKSVMFSYWSSFVPDGISSGKHNIISCILRDTSFHSRKSAFNVLLLLLSSSKLFLIQAESSEKSVSFTPYSVVLGLNLIEIHKALTLALNEQSVPLLTQVLKCVAALIQATPYNKMQPGLITKIIRNVKPLIYHKDTSIQVTALIVTSCILASEPEMPEILEAIVKLQEIKKVKIEQNDDKSHINPEEIDYVEFSSDEEEIEQNIDDSDIPWLLQVYLKNLSNVLDNTPKVVPVPVKIESLNALSVMSRNYFDSLVAPYIAQFGRVLEMCLNDPYTNIRGHAGRAIEFIGLGIDKFITSNDITNISLLKPYIQFWQTLLNDSLIKLLQNDENSTLRTVGCDCLSSIGSRIFEQLPRDKHILCVTILFTRARDEDNSVKGAAVRALAMCILYPSLREDPGFVADTADMILTMLKDENLSVKIKASWSLGNLSDALVLNEENGENDDMPEDLLLKLFNAAILGTSQNEKIKMNGVRALGNLVQLVDDEMIKKREYVEIMERTVVALIKCGTTGSHVKVRWNACYALGKVLKNDALYLINSWQPSVFNGLADLVVTFKNFKVRINAAVALACPKKREQYGQYFVPTFMSLLKALESSRSMEDFTEYKHQDHLVEQICIALGHLVTILTKDDIILLEDTVTLYYDTFKSFMHKVLERLIPEKSAELFSANLNLASLESMSGLNSDQRSVIQYLKNIFVVEHLQMPL